MEKIKRFARNDLWMVLLDIIAVNLGYYLALLLRFYVNFKFIQGMGKYLDMFLHIAPFYTAAAIVVFILFRLYGGMWTYAGLNDMNRIILANVCTAIIQVAISLVMGKRMPITYYVLGAFFQFFIVAVIRFSTRIYMMEKEKIEKGKMETIPALVIGAGDYGWKVIHHLENNTPFKAVAIASNDSGRTLDGISVAPLGQVPQIIQEMNIRAVFIADETLTKSEREAIIDAAQGLKVKDYTGQISNQTGYLPISLLMEVIKGPVHVNVDGEEKEFTTGYECLDSLDGEYKVTSISGASISLKKVVTDDSWMSDYKEQTGMNVSYF